jgi:flavin reductase (DIM6/NTAB) family NADH-FMN oxidoreductase RutF
VQRTGAFTVSYPRPSQLLYTSLAAAPRCADGEKSSLLALPVAPSTKVNGVFVKDSYLVFECEHMRTIDGFGINSLITGRIVSALAAEDALRVSDRDDAEVIRSAPLLAYLHPGRFGTVAESLAFPFPAGMSR